MPKAKVKGHTMKMQKELLFSSSTQHNYKEQNTTCNTTVHNEKSSDTDRGFGSYNCAV